MKAAGTGGASTGKAAGSGGSDPVAMPEMRSSGCGMATTERAGSWTTSALSTGGSSRNYDVRLPQGYDAMKSYPAILLLHGCGSPTNNVPMEQVAGDAAIVVRGSGSKNGCWQETASGADVPYLEMNHCGMDTKPFDPSPCVEYQGCDPGYPVVWCQTSGQAHNRQDTLARTAFWNFFKQWMGK